MMYDMFSTDYYQLIFLFTFESANMVAKAKQKIGSKTTRKLRFGYSTQSFAGYRHSVWTPSRQREWKQAECYRCIVEQ